MGWPVPPSSWTAVAGLSMLIKGQPPLFSKYPQSLSRFPTQTAMTALFSNSGRAQLLTVRCQIWHRSEYRQSYEDNQELASILHFCSSHGWSVKAAQLESANCGNDFVPIEVSINHTAQTYPLPCHLNRYPQNFHYHLSQHANIPFALLLG